MSKVLGLVAAALLAASSSVSLAEEAAQPFNGKLPTFKITEVKPNNIGVTITAEVENPNSVGLDLVATECIGTFAEKKYFYGPGRVFFKTIPAGGKVVGVYDMILDDIAKVLIANPEIKQFPAPTETKCQASKFDSALGVDPAFLYSVPQLAAPGK